MTNGEASGQAIADGILKRIALRYKNCMVNIYPDLPELTPVEGVLRCAAEEGFVLVARPDVAGGPSAEQLEQDKIGRLTGGKCIEALASRREASDHDLNRAHGFLRGRRMPLNMDENEAIHKDLAEQFAQVRQEALASRREMGEGRLDER